MSRGLRMNHVPAEWAGRVHAGDVKLPVAPTTSRGMNKLEQRWAEQLEIERAAGEIRSWRYNSIRLKLADGSWFKPDFVVICADGSMRIDETKGHWREAARVRIRVAAELYPEFRFRALSWHGHEGWAVEAFGAAEGGAQLHT